MLNGAQKAIAAFVISTIGGIATYCLTAFPDNNDVQTWGGLIAGIVTILATTLGVYQIANKPTSPA